VTTLIVDGNEACASVAYRLNELCAIFPITPSSPMAELADEWASEGRTNIWGSVPDVIEMQSEGGAAGALHGALQAGALATTFTASQGLLLMIPNMYKIAGELTSTVIHVAARSIATHALSIFGDHQDVMAVRPTGFAQLASGAVQEAQDLAAIAQMATLEARVPFLHFFDGFRTSHELARIVALSDDDLRALIDPELVRAHRGRALNPDTPFIRGTAQNPDVYFQSREAANPFFARTPGIVERMMRGFAERTGRRYRLFEYYGAPDAERVVVLMGSSAATARETVEWLAARGERVGVLQVRLFRPFSVRHFLAALPPTTRALAVLDRTKESGALAEPLALDVVAALAEGGRTMPVIGGRYGLSSKEFTPAMVKAVLDELKSTHPRNHFVVGIEDDVGHTSLPYDPAFRTEPDDTFRAVFYGLGADGTVGANKNSCKILGEEGDLFVQGYFVYDSKKSGSRTVSHLRFGRTPIRSAYLVDRAHFVGCHQFSFVHAIDVLGIAADGATFLLNSPYGPDDTWEHLPHPVQEEIIRKRLSVWVIDATAVAREAGIPGRTNTVLQTCFFAISGVLPRPQALDKIKSAISKTYGAKGDAIVQANWAAVDATLERLHQVSIPEHATSRIALAPIVPADAPEFVQRVTALMLAGRGDALPVSALPVDGTYPSATSRWEKRNISDTVAEWDAATCIQCGNCAMICPHAAIRAGLVEEAQLVGAPAAFASAPIDERGFPTTRYTLQVYVEDCTGCGLCVEVCPAAGRPDGPTAEPRKAINLADREPLLARAREHVAFFETLPVIERAQIDFATVRGTQFLEPTFEFSGACAGCGETPYLSLLSRLFGDRMLVANATGCSSIYGGNLPTTPWATNREGRGPAWSNSLFEDNAEFGVGMRLAADGQLATARRLAGAQRSRFGDELADALISAPQREERDIRTQRRRVAAARAVLEPLAEAGDEDARQLLSVLGSLVRRSVWIVGGDGWAYDIGSGGLDHVLASGRDVNVLVLDTEVYSNTGGQASKATPLAAVAKFANAGKATEKKDLALQAIAYGNVYVARVALAANPQQTLLALREAEAYPGPSLVLAYSHCIAHGYDLRLGLDQQRRAVHSGYWPLVRYNPELRRVGENPFTLDSPRPTLSFREYAQQELRYRMLTRTNPEHAEALLQAAESAIARRWRLYEDLARLD
jgi:pyruvate-ferredoxin/flavodoxin oxidoreductase